MRLKCPSSGQVIGTPQASGRLFAKEFPFEPYAVCPTCGLQLAVTRHGRARVHSQYSKSTEAFEQRKYRIDRRTGRRVQLQESTDGGRL